MDFRPVSTDPLPQGITRTTSPSLAHFVDEFLSTYDEEITDKLETTRNQWAVLYFSDASLYNALVEVMTGVQGAVENYDDLLRRKTRQFITDVESLGTAVPPIYTLTSFKELMLDSEFPYRFSMSEQSLTHQRLSVSLRFNNTRLVYSSLWVVLGRDTATTHLIVVKAGDVDKLIHAFTLVRSNIEPRSFVHHFKNNYSDRSDLIKDMKWDDIVVDPVVTQALRDDIDIFLKRREWFKAKRLPYHRGYLLQGPPGNGKTSAIRAILKENRMSAYAPMLFAPDMNDMNFSSIVREATKNAPAVLLLEDLDRAFSKYPAVEKCKVTLQHFLNVIDGVSQNDGLIVIASANEPEALDNSILRRPGRFDKVILFDNPNEDLRKQYFTKRNPVLREVDITQLLDETKDFSFAQLQETYIAAGSLSFARGDDEITLHDLIDGARSVHNGNTGTKKNAKIKGFL